MPSTIDKVLERSRRNPLRRSKSAPLADSEIDPLSHLYRIVKRVGGKIPAYRVSSAHARGDARGYAYYGVAQYALVVNSKGGLALKPIKAAPSSRRSINLAEKDLKETIDYQKQKTGGPVLNLGVMESLKLVPAMVFNLLEQLDGW